MVRTQKLKLSNGSAALAEAAPTLKMVKIASANQICKRIVKQFQTPSLSAAESGRPSYLVYPVLHSISAVSARRVRVVRLCRELDERLRRTQGLARSSQLRLP